MGWTYLPDETHDTLNRLAYQTQTAPDTILITLIAQASEGTPLLQWPIDLLEQVSWCDADLYGWLLEQPHG